MRTSYTLKKENISCKNLNGKIDNSLENINSSKKRNTVKLNINDLHFEIEQLKSLNNKLNKNINDLKSENISLKTKFSDEQNENKELKIQINEMQNNFESNKSQYMQGINKLEQDIIDYQQKEAKEKDELENQVKELLNENNDLKEKIKNLNDENKLLKKINEDFEISQKNLLNNINKNNTQNDRNISILFQKQLNQLRSKCNILEENKFQLKSELRKVKQEKDALSNSLNALQQEKKTFNPSNMIKCNFQRLIFEPKKASKIEDIEDEKQKDKKLIKNLEKNVNLIQKKYDDLMKENNKLETKKNELIQQVNDLNDLIDLSNQELVSKILELKKVIEVLNKQIKLEINKKEALENKLIKLQKQINRQIDEASEREEASINIGKESKLSDLNNNINNEGNNSPFTVNKNEQNNNYLNEISSLKTEKESLIKTVVNLKNEIKQLKMRLKSSKNFEDKKSNNLEEKISNSDDEDLIKDITEEMNRWKKAYYNLSKVNDYLQDKISKSESEIGVEEEMKNLKELLSKKDELLMNLTLQLKEYQSKCDEIIIGRTIKNKDKQIEILLNEVKAIRKRLLNFVTLNERITNFDDFMNSINTIKELESKVKDRNIKKAFEQLDNLIEIYKLNNDMAFNDFMMKLFMIE